MWIDIVIVGRITRRGSSEHYRIDCTTNEYALHEEHTNVSNFTLIDIILLITNL